jgi:predicted PurR-regulated permease PerM
LAFTLALIAGLLAFIPNFGPLLAAIPAMLLGLSDSPSKALQVGLVLIIVQIIEGNLVTPLLERKTVRLPPALTVAVQVLLGILAGGLGVLVASPLCAAAIVLVERLYVRDKLKDDLTERTLPSLVRQGYD